jgi:hypothetical protein
MRMRYLALLVVGCFTANAYGMQQVNEGRDCRHLQIYNDTGVTIEVQTRLVGGTLPDLPIKVSLRSEWKTLLPVQYIRGGFFLPTEQSHSPVVVRARLESDHNEMRSMSFIFNKEPQCDGSVFVTMVNGKLDLQVRTLQENEE